MKALTRIKGTYKLKASNDNNSSKVVRQQRKTMRSNRSTSHTYRYEFDEESIKKEDIYFTCNCILTWDLTLDEKTGRESFNNISVRCFIECNEDILGSCTEHVSATERSDDYGIIDIRGYVSYAFNPSIDWRKEHGYGMYDTTAVTMQHHKKNCRTGRFAGRQRKRGRVWIVKIL